MVPIALFPESDERRVLVVYAFSWGCYGGSGGRRTIDLARKTYEFFNFFGKSARHGSMIHGSMNHGSMNHGSMIHG